MKRCRIVPEEKARVTNSINPLMITRKVVLAKDAIPAESTNALANGCVLMMPADDQANTGTRSKLVAGNLKKMADDSRPLFLSLATGAGDTPERIANPLMITSADVMRISAVGSPASTGR